MGHKCGGTDTLTNEMRKVMAELDTTEGKVMEARFSLISDGHNLFASKEITVSSRFVFFNFSLC